MILETCAMRACRILSSGQRSPHLGIVYFKLGLIPVLRLLSTQAGFDTTCAGMLYDPSPMRETSLVWRLPKSILLWVFRHGKF